MNIPPAMIQGLLKQFLTPKALESPLQSAKEWSAHLRAQGAGEIMATIAQDPASGAFVAGFYRQDTGGQWQQEGSLTIATGQDLANLLTKIATTQNGTTTDPKPFSIAQPAQQPAAITAAAECTADTADSEPAAIGHAAG